MVRTVLFVIKDLKKPKEAPMNSLKKSLNVLCLLVLTASAFAQTHEVLMKNRGSAGPMVYEPDYPRFSLVIR